MNQSAPRGGTLASEERAIDLESSARDELAAARLHAHTLETVGLLAAGVAHDLNNVLAAVLACASLDRGASVDQLHAALGEIRLAALRGRSVTNRLSMLSRREPIRSAQFDLVAVVSELASLVSRTFPKTVHVDLAVPEEALLVEGDEGQWHQALLNVAINARDAMPTGGTLRIALQRDVEGASATLTVADTGLGMTREVLARAFDAFFTTKPMGQGTGFGLAHVDAVARAHDVALACHSEPGAGTAFTFRFPRVITTKRARARTPAPAPRLVGRVLSVDDDRLALRGTRRLLENLGLEVVEASSGADALSILAIEGRGLDLVITDLAMPEVDGLAVLHEARRLAPGVPVVIISGGLDVALEDAPERPDAFLAKPFAQVELARTLGRFLRPTSPPAS